MDNEFWDKEAIYDKQIAPLMTKIIKICKDNNIPIVAAFQYSNKKEDGPGFCTTAILSGNEDQRLKNIYFASKPQKNHFALAETHVTNPDGTKTISISRV